MLNLPAKVLLLCLPLIITILWVFLIQIVSGSQALPQREPRSRRSEGNSGGSGAASSGGSGGSGSGGGGSNRQTQQQYNNKDFAKKGGGSGAGGSMGGGGGGMAGSGSGPMSERRGGGGAIFPDAWQIFVGGLPPQTLDSEIRAIFEGQGNILDVRVNPKNFAFVVFDNPEPVQRIMATREQFHLHGRRINIELKRPSAMRYSGPRSGGGGGGGDRGGDQVTCSVHMDEVWHVGLPNLVHFVWA